MTDMRIITQQDHTVMPWKNSGGTTREIATGGADSNTQEWGWRVSIAAVERDGAYSEFPGVDRLTTIVVGNGSDLFHPDGSTIALNPLQPTLIPSDVALWGFLRDEPILNLNVMTRQGRFTATAEIVQGPSDNVIEAGPTDTVLIHALEEHCHVGSGDGVEHYLTATDTLACEAEGRLTVTVPDAARVAIICISPVSA